MKKMETGLGLASMVAALAAAAAAPQSAESTMGSPARRRTSVPMNAASPCLRMGHTRKFHEHKTRIVADEGDPASAADLKASRDALVAIKARVQKLIDQGKSEAEAIAAKPTQDLDARWAPRGGFLSGDVITRMAYQSLQGVTPPAG